ncbi:structural maintenance of chromosomes protein 6B isoform X2 [Punica granatum]|uniref:Structural maintenance of chromosomes protein 6B isoform X2 n=1 Tax=Punica granatum TaxID=22663 RepID=A0A6P8DP57_PUNGR|nr:structural maintenance of chromosomes protein 6B isoform X2 [Punica granatum]
MDDSGGFGETLNQPRAGIITRIRLENFMCHSNLEIELGEWVNFITGQNGSGKSAILTALCVAFGCRAKGTQRASTLKDFIKNGCSSAVIQIELKNRGEDAFKPDIYGDTIMIERRISESTSTTILKDCNGKKIASRKEELRELVEHFNIDVENPCVIMTQDKSREFLHSGNSKEKFKFFYKASLLQQVDELLENISQHLVSADALIGELEATIGPILKELDQLQGKIKNMERLEEISQQLQQLKKKLAWSWVYDVDRELQEQVTKIDKLKLRVPACQAKIDEQLNILENLRECFTEKKTEVENLMERTLEVKRTKGELQDLLTLAKKERNELAQEHDREANKIQKMKKRVHSLQEQIQEMQELQLKNTQDEEFEIKAKISELQNEIEEANEMLNRMKEEENSLSEKVNVGMNEFQQIANEVDDLEKKHYETVSRIRELKQHQTNKVTAFGGDRVIHLLRVIERFQGSFGRPPIGPIGSHLSLVNGDMWAPAVENALGKLLNAFIVASHKDSLVLRKCAKEANYNHLPIIIYDFSRPRLNIPRHMLPRTDHPTALSVLQSENVTVLNVLVDMGNIERQVLVRDYDVGKTVAFNPSISNVKEVFTLDGYKMFSRNGVETILPPIRNRRSGRLCSSFDDQIADLEKEARRATELAGKQKMRKREADATLNNLRNNLHNLKRRCLTSERDLASKKLALEDLKKSYIAEASSPISTVDELHQEISRIKDEIQEKETELEQLKIGRDEADAKARALRLSFEDLCESANGEIDALGRAEAELMKIEEKIESAEAEKAYYEKLMGNKVLNDIKVAEEQYCKLERDRKENFDKASLICPESEIKSLGEWDGSTPEQLSAQVSRLDQRLQDESRQFNSHLNKKGFSGGIKISFKEKTLSVEVKMPQDASRDGVRDTRGLSGGERSFSTLCFSLALHGMTVAPFRAMDEFDVFMDAVSRKISLNTLVEFALAQGSQWIFITPHDISMVKPEDRVKKQQMAAPRS